MWKLRQFSLSSSSDVKTFVLTYKYIDNILTARVPFRPEHLDHANKYCIGGQLIAAGAYDPPHLGAQFIFKSTSREAIESFVKQDPYVINGLVKSYDINLWTVVIGRI